MNDQKLVETRDSALSAVEILKFIASDPSVTAEIRVYAAGTLMTSCVELARLLVGYKERGIGESSAGSSGEKANAS